MVSQYYEFKKFFYLKKLYLWELRKKSSHAVWRVVEFSLVQVWYQVYSYTVHILQKHIAIADFWGPKVFLYQNPLFLWVKKKVFGSG